MRAVLLPALLLLGCQSAPEPRFPSPDGPSRMAMLDIAVQDLRNSDSAEAEAILAAASKEAAPLLHALVLTSEDPEVARKAQSILLYAGEDTGLGSDQRVELLLTGLTRSERHPFLSLWALDRLQAMGEEAIPALERAAERGDTKGVAARRLLSRLREAGR